MWPLDVSEQEIFDGGADVAVLTDSRFDQHLEVIDNGIRSDRTVLLVQGHCDRRGPTLVVVSETK
ncbi:hypothetical protein ACQBAT_04625 [Ornithinimicrobium sp. Y1847]|uniref:hypothetical protein n=1 Tax=Ornithinimicrobium sp. Y1847 TaxID=3405419 RepID=UPI003D01401A